MPKRTRKTPLPDPPFEPAINQWQSITQAFEEAVFRAVPENERRKWINHPLLSGFYVFSCGYFKKAWGHQWERKDLAEGVFIYCVGGKGWLKCENKTWTVSPGDSFYCFPKTHHSYGADPEDPWSLYWMHLSGDALSKYERILNLSQEEPVIHMGLRTEIINLFRSLLKSFHPVPNESEWLASTVCAQHI
ncbi:MAG: AraC family ligand binding domain-containing protein, partial [Phycisphaeraceae bacterium]|nr:AraC family ligand binding domain-containing protein [Phycisphaeraceae bacterium]